ncbi:hypothetical protein [Paracoccus sp. (in: a-proteobacteria)]|uniref:hypothetical protein n=1 Tax=Paracoccus sp. TaxID=267 RepID=UPI0032205153
MGQHVRDGVTIDHFDSAKVVVAGTRAKGGVGVYAVRDEGQHLPEFRECGAVFEKQLN